ncbi:hypothetical protein TRAPUB_13506 [Trametes pubescens]|uniref:Uncharacterized protein n=1 Tax=Trametes pubescens TaxID=154538 RepID=A0A1M2VR05_TRAPU|nr:hypothetical protein TRAPUB_13506 [Trametes pubescens]
MLDAQAFQIMPRSSLNAQNPSTLPREIFVPDGQEAATVLHASSANAPSQEAGASSVPKKKGRPSKRDKIRKAKEALHSLDRYVDRTYLALHQDPYQLRMSADPPASGAGPVQAGHMLFAQAPAGSLGHYSAHKHELLGALYAGAPDGPEQAALRRVNDSILARLKQIDEMAAEKGLEVGGEGGEKTGLARVEKAVEELRQGTGVGASGGILGLLEGAGMDMT